MRIRLALGACGMPDDTSRGYNHRRGNEARQNQGGNVSPASIAHSKSARKPGMKGLYVHALLALLPHLANTGRRLSKTIATETKRLPNGFSFALSVRNFPFACVCRKMPDGSIRSSTTALNRCDYLIDFRDLDYAFSVFCGTLSLQDALSARLFSTRGPNSAGVGLTYLFTRLLHAFFFWRAAYRKQGGTR